MSRHNRRFTQTVPLEHGAQVRVTDNSFNFFALYAVVTFDSYDQTDGTYGFVDEKGMCQWLDPREFEIL